MFYGVIITLEKNVVAFCTFQNDLLSFFHWIIGVVSKCKNIKIVIEHFYFLSSGTKLINKRQIRKIKRAD